MNGILALNKSAGMTSFGAVREARKILNERKIGHAGTLDPTAVGLLPICVGRATRLVDYFHQQPKQYHCVIRLGQTSDTLDTEGEITSTQDASAVTEDAVRAALPTFVGEIEQIPPMHSAVRHEGRKLYEIARAGEEVERAPRKVMIYSATLTAFRPGEIAEAEVIVDSGKGAYMRTLAADLGAMLSVGGLLAWLERTSYGPLHLNESVTLDQLRELEDPSIALLSPAIAVEFLPRIDLAPQQASKLRSGQSVWVPRLPQPAPAGECRAHGPNGDLLALGMLQGNLLRPTKVLSQG